MNESAASSGSVVLAGGGTAGHTSPLIATGLELRRLSPGVTLTALGTARGLETTVVPEAGLDLPVGSGGKPGYSDPVIPQKRFIRENRERQRGREGGATPLRNLRNAPPFRASITSISVCPGFLFRG